MPTKSAFEVYIVNSIKQKRISLGKKQKEIAEILGVTVGYIGQIESEKSKSMYTYDQLNKLASSFDCSPKDFMPESSMDE